MKMVDIASSQYLYDNAQSENKIIKVLIIYKSSYCHIIACTA